MASPLEAGTHFRYQSVQILKSQPLGVGSYGAVYKAKCDELPCAAKLLHPTFFQTGDPGAWKIQQRFEQECHFLSGIRHPHIVQYLGTCRDRESGLPVLLMELMDDSLTHFLEECHERLSYHLEVNLCHDVALALAYLHSNGIIHRDLSSNNVLLIAGNRAKVTDFGMSRLVDHNPRMTPLTLCPGTIAYMSPEATIEPPVYTDKLDCFAHGVVAIQIMTLQFPKPRPPTQLVDDPRYPTGPIRVPVPEQVRRISHTTRIDPQHPLLPIAIQCLSFNEKDRPTAQQICNQLAVLKEATQYAQSKQQAREENRQLTRDNQQLAQDNQQLMRQLQDKEHIIAEFQQNLTQKDKIIRDLEETISAREREIQEQPKLKPEIKRSEAFTWRQGTKAPCTMSRGSAIADGSMTYFQTCGSNIVRAYDSDNEVWSQLPECPQNNFTLAIVKGLLTAVGGYQSGNHTNTLLSLSLTGEGSRSKWSEHFPCMPTKRYGAAVVCTGRSLIVAGGWEDNCGGGFTPLSTVEVMDTDSPKWFTASSLPHPLTEASATICGENLYLLGGYDLSGPTTSVFTCSLNDLLQPLGAHSKRSLPQDKEPRVWHTVADVPVYRSTCTTLCGQLLAVGGRHSRDSDYKRTTAIHKYDPVKKSWTVISHMTTPRYWSLVAVLPGDKLMVVGGVTPTDTVEIAALKNIF